MPSPTVERLAAFTTTATGGNPAGVWIGSELPPPAAMQEIAAEVGYSETAFLVRTGESDDDWMIRYYSPETEIEFCGHATVAAGTVLGRRFGERTFHLETSAGEVPVRVETTSDRVTATLTSVEPDRRDVPATLRDGCLRALGWSRSDLDPALPLDLAYAGAWHMVVPVADRPTLASLEYDFDALKEHMLAADLTTIQIIWRERSHLFHARNPFPVGGVVEDPATGAAAAALGGYLRHHRLVELPADIVIRQGEDMGRPSRIDVHIPTHGGIDVSGHAVAIEPEEVDESVSSVEEPAGGVDHDAHST
ncbi:MAG: PhzF family phenazine biosynthesis protein [Acidimicrobiia bacterium]|nr:PhzF family phenazine biosynthesis protein [Acidimicrobiia bacterium]